MSSSTVISTGRILTTLSSAADPGGPGIFTYTGRVVYQIDADGNTASGSRIPNSHLHRARLRLLGNRHR
jgi:hypothetical protein